MRTGLKLLLLLVAFTVLLSGVAFWLGQTMALAADEPKSQQKGQTRQYPGGADEEDLKVQPRITLAPAVVDRRSIEQKVLKNFMKTPDSVPASDTPETYPTENE